MNNLLNLNTLENTQRLTFAPGLTGTCIGTHFSVDFKINLSY